MQEDWAWEKDDLCPVCGELYWRSIAFGIGDSEQRLVLTPHRP